MDDEAVPAAGPSPARFHAFRLWESETGPREDITTFTLP